MSIVPVRSLPLFAFANDGSIAWLRAEGAKVIAVDARSGRVLREVTLDPAPFGISWSIQRVGRFFVVKDDRELSAYEDGSGTRLWKRTGPTRIAFVGQTGERHVTIAPGPAGVDVLEADLATGELSPRLGVDGTMHYIGAHGTMTGDLLVFATDQRDVFAVDTTRWAVVARHSFPARTRCLRSRRPPASTSPSSSDARRGRSRRWRRSTDRPARCWRPTSSPAPRMRSARARAASCST